jgi:hypothetical protein
MNLLIEKIIRSKLSQKYSKMQKRMPKMKKYNLGLNNQKMIKKFQLYKKWVGQK